jgi:hypothetical protein
MSDDDDEEGGGSAPRLQWTPAEDQALLELMKAGGVSGWEAKVIEPPVHSLWLGPGLYDTQICENMTAMATVTNPAVLPARQACRPYGARVRTAWHQAAVLDEGSERKRR